MGDFMSKKKLKLIGIIISFIICFPFHFVYDKVPSFLTSRFFPVNESIWEHMKILFGSVMFSSICQKLIMYFYKEELTNICFSNFIGAILSIPIFLIMFLPMYYTIGENFPLTIFFMFLTIVICEIISYFIMIRRDFNMENKTILLVILVYIIFGILTYFPPENDLFVDFERCFYSIMM